MTPEHKTKPLASTDLRGTSEAFAAYCELELERRRNSGEPFDEAACQEAMEMVLTRLEALENEGRL